MNELIDSLPTPPDAPENHGLPALTPDAIEQEKGEGIDNVVPTEGFTKLPVVGLGGSAGGLAALQAFFGAMSPDCGMAFVVIMHLSPEHESILAEVLQRTTTMPVQQVQGRVKVEANCVYVIPPAKHLSMADGHLHLSDLARTRPGKHVAVDLFFRTLADTNGAHCAAVVFSGADGDGAIGIKRIKERGGLTIAQDPGEAEQDSMPRSTIATGMVDWVLPAADIPARLCAYWSTEKRLRLPSEEGPQPAREPAAAADRPATTDEVALHDVLGFLRARTGRDFTYYKRATILRRVARRMQVNGIEEVPHYLGFLRTHPGETGALLQDMLISVTNFFRDREAFAALEAVIPTLFRDKGPKDTLRVWCAACATGEEAYSVAMLLTEHADQLEHPPTIQVFATDLDENAIQQARDGEYSETISADVSEERLRRFFNKGHGKYRVKREVRETVLFALHDLLKDSPFSRLDLVTCRNLLIYLNRDAQERALDIFHFSLNPDGALFLGTSETVDEASALFAVTDTKYRLYARRALARPKVPPTFAGPSVQTQALLRHRQEASVLPKTLLAPPTSTNGNTPAPDGEQASWSEVHSRAVEQFGSPSVIIDSRHHLVHLSGHAGRLLQFSDGELTTDLLRVVHPALRVELRAAIFRAEQSGEVTETFGVPVNIEGVQRAVDLRVVPTVAGAPGFLLVIFTEREFVTGVAAHVLNGETEPAVRELERELEQSKAQLRDTIEQADANQEELKAANEELQAMNEELRSSGEELETGREELQSINEELTTVNLEMKSKVEELARSNGDLQNLMASTQIATIFLDRQLCIGRYTPPAVALFNLIPTDVGRPLADLTSRLNYPDLAADAERVLDDLTVAELEVGHADGRCFLARMRPYRTQDDHISGVVATFVDISARKQAEHALRESMERYRTLFTSIDEGFCVIEMRIEPGQPLDYKFIETNGGFDRQSTLVNAEGKWMRELRPEHEESWFEIYRDVALTGQPIRFEHGGRELEDRWFTLYAFRVGPPEAKRVAVVFSDITDRKRSEEALRASEMRLKLVLESARDFAILTMDEQGAVTSWNRGAQTLFGYAAEEIVGQSGLVLCTPEDRAVGKMEQEADTAQTQGRALSERWHLRKDGSFFWGSGSVVPLDPPDGEGASPGVLVILSDRTEARLVEQDLEEHRQKLEESLQQNERARAEVEAASAAKDHFLAVLSHELRTPLTPVTLAVHMLARNPELPESAYAALETIQRNVQIEAHFIDDLLDLTKIAHGKLEIVREPLDLHEAVRRAVEVSAGDLQAKNQQITVNLEAAEHQVQGDATRLQQAFWNLLKNASKFTPKGSAIHVTSRNEPGWIVVEVSDTGIGFDAEVAARIFDAFAQASLEVTRQFGGLGLGLAISKATVNAHEGTLSARSDGPNQGATFTVALPLLPSDG